MTNQKERPMILTNQDNAIWIINLYKFEFLICIQMGQSGTRVDFISNKQASLLSWTSSLSVSWTSSLSISSGSCLTLVCKLFTWIKFLRIPDWGFPLALDWWQWHLLTKGGREKCSKNWVPFPPMKWRTWSDRLLGHSLGYGALLGSSEHEVMDASLWNQWRVREPVLLRKLSCCTHGIPDTTHLGLWVKRTCYLVYSLLILILYFVVVMESP